MISFTSQLMLDEMRGRGWKAEMLDETASSVIVVTLPKGKTHYFLSCLPDTASAVGYAINQDKLATYKIAERLRIPVADYQMYDAANPASAREFLAAQKLLGHELVVKPTNRDHGNGVVVGVDTEASLTDAIAHALSFSNRVILQRRFIGDDCRLAIVDGACVAVVRRTPPCVIGDGHRTVQELLVEKNSDPRRGTDADATLRPIDKADVVRFIGTNTFRTVPAAGESITLLGTANLSKGGESEDITDSIHVSYAQAAARIASEVGLTVCGVDLLCKDIMQPLSADNAVLIEINGAIGLRLHHRPTKGQPRNVAGAIVDAFARKHL